MSTRFRRNKRQRRSMDGELALQITSLADIFIIVLVFLLKSYSAGLNDMENVQIPAEIVLPSVVEGGIAKTGLKIEVSESQVNVGGERASALSRFRFYPGDLNNDLRRGGTSKSLTGALKRARQDEPQTDEKPRVWVIADYRVPYATIQTVLASAAMNGYEDFKLVVTRNE